MNKYAYRGRMMTINELSDMSGIRHHTLRDRLRRGYSVEQAVKPFPIHDSVEQFCEASHWKDWIGMSINELYEIYWKWCVAQEIPLTTKQGFSRHITDKYPTLKIVPTRRGDQFYRIIRMR